MLNSSSFLLFICQLFPVVKNAATILIFSIVISKGARGSGRELPTLVPASFDPGPHYQAIDCTSAITHFPMATVLPVWNVSHPIPQLSEPVVSPERLKHESETAAIHRQWPSIDRHNTRGATICPVSRLKWTLEQCSHSLSDNQASKFRACDQVWGFVCE